MKIKKILAVVMATVTCLTASTLTACGRDDNNLPPDVGNKTVLTVSNYGGGFGSSWLNKAKARFEAKYVETEFETGKKGVYVDIQNTLFSGQGWAQQTASRSEDVFFSEQIYYPDAVAGKYFLDITDIVTENMSKSQGEDKTIESKLTQEQLAYYKRNGKYYGLPHYAGYFGITYDADLFDEKGFYINEARNGLIKKTNGTWSAKSVGPDGEAGTDDDGLPVTYDELFMLCGAMVERGVTPFVWSGALRRIYLHGLINALYADYEGLDNFMLNFTFSGTADDLVDSVTVDEEGKITALNNLHSETLTPATGYKVYSQAGRAYALSFLERIVKGTYFSNRCTDESFTNIEAQREFIESRPYGESPIAMLIDGNFWESEASAAFVEVERDYPADKWKKENRRFGYMPLPKATEEKVGTQTTLFDYLYGCAYINGTIPQSRVTAAKTFLQFCYTDESLVEFTTTTNTPKALKYDLTDEQIENLSYYGKTEWNVKKSAKTAYPFADNDVYLYAQSDFNMLYNWNSLFGTDVKKTMIDAIRKDEYTSAQVFAGLSGYYTEQRWKTAYGEYIKD